MKTRKDLKKKNDGDEPGDDAPGDDAPGEDAPGDDAPADDAAVADAPSNDAPDDVAPDGDAPGDDAPGEEMATEMMIEGAAQAAEDDQEGHRSQLDDGYISPENPTWCQCYKTFFSFVAGDEAK